MKPTTIAVAAAIALCAATYGCGSTPVAEATSSRYEFEHGGSTKEAYGVDAWTMTDTETGRQWVVLRATDGGVAIEPLSPYVQVGMSDDRGE